jgi:nucleotide-binding universal stress UspA family protein
MKTVIIPIDFSETSLHAARYAAQMLAGKKETSVILYNMFEKEEESKSSGRYLESLKSELLTTGVANVECVKELGDDLIDNLGRLAYQKQATLIIMGITDGKSEWKQMLFSSNTVKMAEENVCPVMIIPPVAKFKGIKNVAFTSDFKNVATTTPVLPIKMVLEMFSASLHIVNIDNRHYVSLTESYLAERAAMLKLFSEYKPEFYFIGMNDFYEGIEQFSIDKNIDLLVIIPKNHSFINSLFSTAHTKKLAFQSSVPILAAHE